MSSAAEILVIIISIFLGFFLLLGIGLTIYLINLTRQIRRVTNSAERTIDSFGSIVSKCSNAISPVIVAEMVAKVIKKFKKDNEKEEK
jgi:phosphotransferase system  glucose/maltose/N-acetylglucosamine-specific IIC component